MKKIFIYGLMPILMVAFTGLNFTSCSSDDEEGGFNEVTEEFGLDEDGVLLQSTDGIIEVTEKIGNWDKAFLTNKGYFCYNKNFEEDFSTSTITKTRTDGSESDYSILTFIPLEKDKIVSLITTKEGHIPTQMATKDGIFYFSFPNDTILELLYDNGKSVTMLDSIAYKKDLLLSTGGEDTKETFKSILANTASLLKLNPSTTIDVNIKATIDIYTEIFYTISGYSFVENKEVVESLTTISGNLNFTITINGYYEEYIKPAVKDVLSIWTGKATFKVGGSSCTLSGTIWCTSEIYNEYGTYGILCDTNPENLTVGNAEYEDYGYQGKNDLSFDVDFRGFKPNTTYYYRAFYKFNTSDHGNIVIKDREDNADIVYDNTIKTFTTGDNILSVDVVMCIDVTGSMSGIINTVKKNATEFYELFKKKCDKEGIILSGLNTQVISFRDKNVDRQWLESSITYSLPEEISEFKTYVNNLRASGGGDIAESGLEALDAAFSKPDWGVDDGYHRQVVILWTDAPYLVGDSYTNLNINYVKNLWNNMPSGRRLILFAANGTDYNGGSWSNLDDWKNVMHETNLYDGFNNFEYILESIIGELTSKASIAKKANAKNICTKFTPNK